MSWITGLFGWKKEPSRPTESEMLDALALALADEVASETGCSKVEVLEQIVKTGESLHVNSSKSSPQSQQIFQA